MCVSGLLLLSAGVTQASAANVRSTSSLRSLARIYMASGGYEKAQPLLESALDLARSRDAADSEMCACALDLAFLYKNQGRLAEAEEMCLAGLELQEKLNGPNHPHVAHTLRILSEIYQGQVRYRQAAESLERAITIMRKVAGEDAVEIAPLRVDMARLLVTQGQFARAESLFAETLVAIENGYGPEHAYTAKVLTSMARLYLRQGRHRRAEELAARALVVLEKVYGANHHFLVPIWLVMSGTCQAQGKLAEAKTLLEKSLAVTSKRNAYGRLAESDVLSRLGEFHILCENYYKAEPVLRKALEILASSQGADSDRTAVVP
ncbi:MAG: tetratricopeptide repeat protein [Planctomycetota bacterium]|jgi:tetratricopeptide (TPR) repeat protein